MRAEAELAAADHPLAPQFRELLARDPRSLYRDGGPVHLTASALVIDADRRQVALIWHRKGGFWVQPGGHLEAGETSFELAAAREVAEETGLDGLERIGTGPAMLHQHGLEAAFGSCRAHWDVQYLLRTPRPAAETPLATSPESPQVRWFPLRGESLPAGIVPDLPGTLAQLGLL